jgi:hypothetical protein
MGWRRKKEMRGRESGDGSRGRRRGSGEAEGRLRKGMGEAGMIREWGRGVVGDWEIQGMIFAGLQRAVVVLLAHLWLPWCWQVAKS